GRDVRRGLVGRAGDRRDQLRLPPRPERVARGECAELLARVERDATAPGQARQHDPFHLSVMINAVTSAISWSQSFPANTGITGSKLITMSACGLRID